MGNHDAWRNTCEEQSCWNDRMSGFKYCSKHQSLEVTERDHPENCIAENNGELCASCKAALAALKLP